MPFLNYLAVPGNSLTGVLPTSIFSMQYLIAFLAVRLGAQQCSIDVPVLINCAQLLCPATQRPFAAHFWVAELPGCTICLLPEWPALMQRNGEVIAAQLHLLPSQTR